MLKADEMGKSSTPEKLANLGFYEVLCQVIKPKDQSDRTCFRNIAKWATIQIEQKKYTSELYTIIISFAREAVSPKSRNHAAVFVSILKKEFGYVPGGK